MRLIIDANVVFSALLSKGKPLQVFEDNFLLNKFEFISPEYLFVEIESDMEKILEYSHYSPEEFNRVLLFLNFRRRYNLVPVLSSTVMA